ncbi:MAG: DUF2849 domain-containing protein [Hyphococcus sp.]
MKAVTGNRLFDGAVVYLNDNDQWTTCLAMAAQFAVDDADAVLAAARSRAGEIVDAYLIDVSEDRVPAGREALRETIRTAGPTVRRDLGYQAGA